MSIIVFSDIYVKMLKAMYCSTEINI